MLGLAVTSSAIATPRRNSGATLRSFADTHDAQNAGLANHRPGRGVLQPHPHQMVWMAPLKPAHLVAATSAPDGVDGAPQACTPGCSHIRTRWCGWRPSSLHTTGKHACMSKELGWHAGMLTHAVKMHMYEHMYEHRNIKSNVFVAAGSPGGAGIGSVV
eukprot:353572-Chlamydomonas_euryale.AAC.7